MEGNEAISVSGSSSGGHRVTGTSLTLTDDDNHQIALSASPSSVGEGASATSVTVTATAKYAASSARTVTVKVGGSGTATSGTDYAAVTDFTITIAANAKTGTGTFTLTPTQDTTVEGSETIGLAGTSTNSTVAGTTVTLTDDDSYPAITLSANPSSVSEGASATSVTVTATAASAIASARTVTVSVGGGGTASRGTDYATVADFTITIAANATSGTGTFTLTPAQDTEVEGSETIGVAGTSPSSTVTGTTVTLADDDTHAIDLSASPSSVSESKASETVTVSATINAARSSATTVTVSVGESGDEATSGTDYEAVSDFTVTIAANKTSGTGTFTFKPKTDTAYEGFESVTISGTTSSGGGGVNALGANAANASIPVTDTSLSIHDSSNYPAVTLSAAPSSVGEGAGATSVTVTATAASAIASSREVTVSVGGSGTATSGTDYTAVSDFIVKIAANATTGTGTFTLTPADDSTVEGSETIGVAGTSLSTTVTGTTVTLTDNDTATVTVNDASAAEGSDMTFTVTLSAAVQGGLTVTPSFTDVTATEGTDYDENTTALTFTGTANETKTITVSTTQDTVVEGNETFTVGLSVSGAPSGVTSTDTGTGTINSKSESNVDTATLTIDDASASEGDGITFTVTLSEAVSGGLTVTPGYTHGTAGKSDYSTNTTALSFTGTKGETETFTVSTTEDAVLEANETFTVSLTVSGTTLGDRITATDTGTGTINNDDSTAVTVNDASASEGNSMTFTVTLSEAVQGGLTVTPDFTDVTATEGTDYDENTTALSFSGTKGETKTFTVSTDEDAVLEANETFTVGLSVSGTTLSITATDTGTGTINDDDSAAVTVNDTKADEGDGMTFTVTLSEKVQGGLKVTPGYTNGTAASGDYTANTTALSFTGTKGETKTFTVSTTEDAVLEGNETFTVGLTVSDAPTGTTVTATDTGTGTINNDDSAAVTVNDANADEGNGMTFTVTLSAAVQGGLKVTPGYTNGTAASGDYTANTTALTFTGTANETKTFTVSTTGDAVLEADETFTVGLRVSGTSLSITATDTGTGTINNDDSAAVTVNDANADEGNDISFTVTLDEAVQGGLTVTPGFTDGTAVEGTDYTKNTKALSFSGTKGETRTFTVSTTEDDVVEGNETFTVDLTVSGTSLGITATDTGTGTINNDDGAVVTVNNAGAEEGESITFTVTLGDAVQGGLTVTPGFTDVTATEGTDYDENTAALSFSGTKGETRTFTVSTTQDAVLEADETFTVGLSVSGTSLSITATDTGTGTIDDDDSAEVTVNDANASEGNSMTFTVTLDKAVQGGLTVTPGYTNGTASSTDYAANTAALTFTGTKGETQTFTVSTTEDAILEGAETFTVGLSVSNSTVTATDTGTGTINDDDGSGVIIADASADEGDGMTFTVTLTEAVQGGLTVTPGFTDGTAVEGTDYTENTTVLNFAGTANETRTFTVQTTEDTVLEGNEAFTVGLTASGTSLDVDDDDTGIGTIVDDDNAPSVNLSADPASVGENDGATPVTVTAAFSNATTYATDTTVTVSVGASGDSAASGTDYGAVSDFTITIAAGQTSGSAPFVLTPVNDALVEGDETISVDGTAVGLTVNGTEVTLTEDESAPIIDLSADPASVAEDAGSTAVTVTAAFSNSSTYETDTTVTVSVGAGGDSAASGMDYRAVADFAITIAAGETSGTGTFTLTPANDTLIEGNETISLDGTATELKVNGTSMTLTDDDGASAINLSVSPSSVSEDAGATTVTVTAAFSNASTYGEARTVTVSVGDTKDTATPGTDYAAVPGFEITIAAGKTSGTGTFTLTPANDTLIEGNEAISLDGTATELNVNGALMTLTDDDGAAAINLSVSPSSVAEDAGATTVTVTAAFSNASTYGEARTVTVTVGAGGDSAVSGTDYAAVPGFEITIAAGKTNGTGTFSLTPADDTLVEGDETIGIDGSTAGMAVNGTSMTVTDNDTAIAASDDEGVPEIHLSVDPPNVAEASGTKTVTVTAAFNSASTYDEARTVSVTVGAGGDSAVPGTDYAAVPGFEITIAAGESSGTGTFTLTPANDTLIEGNEAISVDGTATEIAVHGTSMTLTDAAAAPAIDLSVSPSTVAEDSSATRVTVTAAFTSASTYDEARTVSVTVGAGGDSAVSGTDYAAVPGFEITIAAGKTSGTGTFTLTPANDTLVEGDETITVDGSAAGMAVHGTSMTLTDEDAAPAINLSVDPSSVAEDAGATTVTVTAAFSNASTYAEARTVTVSAGASGDSAASGTDYGAVTDFDLIIAAGASGGSATFTLTPTQDTLVEGDETITVGGSAAELTVNGTSMTLTDDDRTPEVGVEEDEPTEDEALPRVSVADARADEGADLIFKVTLDRAADDTVSVAYATANGAAKAGKDYTAVSGTLSFAPGDTEGTVTVETLDDAMDEGDETFLLRLSRPAGTALADPSAVGTIVNEDPLPAALTIHCGRSSAEHAVDAVKARLNGDRYGSHLTIGGEQVPITGTGLEARPAWHSMTPEGQQEEQSRSLTGNELMAESSFRLSPPAETEHRRGDERWTAWGSGASTGFEGRADQLHLEGEVVGATVGLDAESDRWTVGVAAAHNRCEGTWRDAKSGQSGKMESPLTSVHPYLRWADGALSLWGVLGLGQGDMTVTVDGKQEDSYTTGVDMGMVALGGRRGLASAEESGGLEIAALWDTLLVWTTSDAAEDVSASRSHTSRTRLGLEAGRTLDLGGGAVLTPSLELGLRHDGGDAETGFGVEIGGEVLYTDASLGLTLGVHGRGMLVHEDADYREWGARGTVQVDPGTDGLGLSVRLEPSWGTPESGVAGMWDSSGPSGGTTFDGGIPEHLDAEVGWGLEAWDGRAVLTPVAGFGRSSEGEQILRLGARLSAVNGLELSLSGEHRMLGDGEAERALVLRARAVW